ncbi:NADH dehydrogenase subunit 5 [Tanacetum coccineum]|uniref:NADH dehydrogenase subunit 5 n=1 Tax=Tanacetum coccineum TaxID=301880 RepID=A0ABQ5CA96_9ASTR
MKKKKREENYQLEMLEGAKLIGAGAATIASAGAAIGIGNVLSSSIHSVARNPSLAKQSFGYAILGFALTEAIASFAPMMAFLISSVFRSKNQRKKVWERSWSGKAKTAPRIWVARGRLCPDGGALWGRAQPNRDSTPPTSSAPLYRLNHSKGLIGGTGEPRELTLETVVALVSTHYGMQRASFTFYSCFSFLSRLVGASVYRLCSLCEASEYKIEKNALHTKDPYKESRIKREDYLEFGGNPQRQRRRYRPLYCNMADKAAIKAMLVNRVGDFGLAPGISGCFTLFQTVDFSTIFACASVPRNSWISRNMRLNAITLICILLLIGAAGKSTQIGSHTWSPDAIEGPTLVSTLIHAATMVTVGVFMIARCSPLFEYPPTALIVITFAGAMTSFLAATTGILQNDLKRVIAYSTCSQLGYMIFACGISNYSVSVFHLMNHAFFKALLFLSAGSVIHAMSDEQDMRKMGGLASSFPFTYAMMLMGSLSLIGFPFPTGFYSKDVILELAYTKYTISGNFAFWLGSVSVLFTSYYSFRSLFLTFLGPTNSFGRDILRGHDAPIPMAIPLILLALGSLFVGYLAKV